MSIKVKQVNENNIIVYFSDKIAEENMPYIGALIKAIKQLPKYYVIDLTPSYTSLLITFNPRYINYKQMLFHINKGLRGIGKSAGQTSGKQIQIPAYYGEDSGLDLVSTADAIGLKISDVIKLHSDKTYTVFALGFLPGYAFMGILDPKLALPRLDTPRAKVPSGSVAIAMNQTAVYPSTTPGGWRCIGRSPMKLFDANKSPPTPYRIGDRVKFEPITRTEYLNLGGILDS